jgi:hypothetical protein
MAFTPPPAKPCPLHPDVMMEWVQKKISNTNGRSYNARKYRLWWVERCEECEWNPPKIGGD